MKTLKILFFFLLINAQAAISQNVGVYYNKATIEHLQSNSGDNTLLLTIPMIGNVAIQGTDKDFRAATLPLYTNQKGTETELLSDSENDEKESLDKELDYPRDK